MTAISSSAVLRRFPTPNPAADSLSFAARRLPAWGGKRRTVVLTVPAPPGSPEALLAVCDRWQRRHPAGSSLRPPGLLWDDGDGVAFAGVGASHRLEVSGCGRIDQLKAAAARLWRRLDVATHDACRVPPPRLYGGLAFAPGAADRDPWGEFGDGCFMLPRWLYATGGAQRPGAPAVLSLAVRGEHLASRGRRAAVLDELEQLLAALAEPPLRASPAEPGRVLAVQAPPRRPWIEHVEEIRRAIAGGRFAKIVAAHRSRVEIGDPPALLARLGQGPRIHAGRIHAGRIHAGPDGFRFAFHRSRSTFLGCTPERLIRRDGREIATEALAGTAGAGARHSLELLASAKDRHEHQLVVDAIVERLRPFCRRLRRPASPRIRRLSRLQHLQTPIAGTLAGGHHVLDLVAALHPTPAVGGVPTAAAMRWIRDHERQLRGWYAAPVGWFDAAGDGDFAVALRSCLLRRTAAGAEAFVYAGAGIVADSDPEREYAETELKMQTLMPALGGTSPRVSPRDPSASEPRVLPAAHRWTESPKTAAFLET